MKRKFYYLVADKRYDRNGNPVFEVYVLVEDKGTIKIAFSCKVKTYDSLSKAIGYEAKKRGFTDIDKPVVKSIDHYYGGRK